MACASGRTAPASTATCRPCARRPCCPSRRRRSRKRPRRACRSSYELRDPNALPSTQNEARLVDQLLNRADGNIKDGDSASANSDLTTAASTLDGLRGVLPQGRLNALDSRLVSLQRRLSGN